MIKVSKPTTQRLLTIHGWAGVILGLALYIVVLTGSIVVFSHEIGAWSVSGHKLDHALAGKIDNHLTELAEQVEPKYLEDVTIWQNSAGYLIAFFHNHIMSEQGLLTEEGTRFILDPDTMEVVSRADGLNDDMPAVKSSFLEDFFLDLHIRLHAPDPIGLYLTGILGLVLLISAVSGFILHRHLIKDIFLSPRLSTRLLNTRDRHNLAGTWGIIFSILLAFTGAFFSFATTLGLPVIAITAFEGDQQKAVEVIFGVQEKEDPRATPFIGLEPIVKQAQQPHIAGSVPVVIVVEHWGRADAKVTTTHEPNGEKIFFSNYQFDGVTGNYLGEKPGVGTEPSLGSNLISLMAVLHFGWFAGVLSKIIWLSLGLATCYVTLTGLQLWVRRRSQHTIWQRMAILISIIGYGTPIAMSGAAIGFLLTYATQANLVESWTIAGFFIGAAVSFLLGSLMSSENSREDSLQLLLGLVLLCLPITRSITTDYSWIHHISNGDTTVVAMDVSLFLSGLVFLFLSTGILRQTKFVKEHALKGEVLS